MSEHRSVHQCNADLPTRAKLRAEGAANERERIIKLLKAEWKNPTVAFEANTRKYMAIQFIDLLKLIEEKE